MNTQLHKLSLDINSCMESIPIVFITHIIHISMSFLKPLEELNNEGVRLYEQGNLQAAKNYFQLCMDEMFKVLAIMKLQGDTPFEAQHVHFDNLPPSKDGRKSHSPIQGWSYPLSSPSTTATFFWPDDEQDEKQFVLFSRAILLCASSETTRSTQRSLADLRIFKLAIQYNKALTHHQIARRSTTRSSEDTEIAFYMYELAFQSCKEECSNHQEGGFSTTLDQGIIVLALFTNMGVVFCHNLGSYEEGTECFKAACGIILGMDIPQLQHVLDQQELYQLSMNIWRAPKMGVPELV